MKIAMRIVPNAKAFRVEQTPDGYKVYVRAKAENNKANIALQKGLRKLLGYEVRLIAGAKARNKVLEIEGPEEEVRNALRIAGGTNLKKFGRFGNEVSNQQKKELKKLMEKLKDSIVLVEGKKDQFALEPYVRGRVLQISGGRLRGACEKAAEMGAREAVILTDRDNAGEELARMASDELRSCGINADLDTRKKLMAILRLTFVENFDKKYEEKLKEINEN